MFIPMCIGNTIKTPSASGLNPVYPYVYREHKWNLILAGFPPGLSLCV